MGILIIEVSSHLRPATRSAPWPLMAAKAATWLRRMQPDDADAYYSGICTQIHKELATMNVFRPEDYQELLTEALKIDELWRIKADDLGYCIVNG